MSKFDFKELQDFLVTHGKNCVGQTWAEVASLLTRIRKWEIEDRTPRINLKGKESLEFVKSLIPHNRILLSRKALRAILTTYLNGQFAPDKICEWADILECEAIEYEEPHEPTIANILFELSTPEINGTLTRERLVTLIEMLS